MPMVRWSWKGLSSTANRMKRYIRTMSLQDLTTTHQQAAMQPSNGTFYPKEGIYMGRQVEVSGGEHETTGDGLQWVQILMSRFRLSLDGQQSTDPFPVFLPTHDPEGRPLLQRLEESHSDYVVHEMGVKQTLIHWRDLWDQLSSTFDVATIDLRSIEDWVNDARHMAKKGTLPTDEQLRQGIKTGLGSVFAGSYGFGETMADNLLEHMGYSEAFEGETLYCYYMMANWMLDVIKTQSERIRSEGMSAEMIQRLWTELESSGEMSEQQLAEMKELMNLSMKTMEQQRATGRVNQINSEAVARKAAALMEGMAKKGEVEYQDDVTHSDEQVLAQLNSACYRKDVKELKYALWRCRRRGLDLDTRDQNGQVALHTAISNSRSHVTIIELLLKAGAPTSGDFSAALALAETLDLKESAQLLLDTQHARRMWSTWFGCRRQVEQGRAALATSSQEGTTADTKLRRLLELSPELFRECVVRAWGPSYYRPEVRTAAVTHEQAQGRYVAALLRCSLDCKAGGNDKEDIGPLGLHAGDIVTIFGLEGRPELNGKTGTVIRWMPSRSRYELMVLGETKVLGVKPGNLTPGAPMDESMVEDPN